MIPAALSPPISVAVVIPAHNEAAVLPATLASLQQATAPPEAIFVIADHCTDATAELAAASGATVFHRTSGEGTKGAVLRWFFPQFAPALATYAVTVILDADSLVHPGFFVAVRQAFATGAQVVQGFVQPVQTASSVATTLAAYSEVLSQVLDDALRARLGWGVRLRGTGMAFQTGWLPELFAQIHTKAEDIELGLLLAEQQVTVQWTSIAIVYDPKPPSTRLVAHQRARWLQGQVQIGRRYGWRILRVLAQGPTSWWLLQALLLKPQTLVTMLKAFVWGVLLLTGPDWLQWGLGLWLLADVLYYLGGLWVVPAADRQRYALALLQAPVYGWVWLQGTGKALVARQSWLSVRDGQ